MSHLGIYNAPSRPGSSYSNFMIPSSSSSSHSDGDENDAESLPFPTALSRRDFLSPDFDPAAYLSQLHTGPTARHQTLEDLRAELRERSAAISNELLELVNANYTSFLGLGDELKGGEERVEDVRVALLGFRRAIEEIQTRVRDRRVQVGGLTGQLGDIKSAIESGRRMLELDERVSGLEMKLAMGSVGKNRQKSEANGDSDSWDMMDDSEDEDDEDDEEDEESDELGGTAFVGSSPAKLQSLAGDYLVVEQLADALGRDLAFVKKMEERMMKCRNTILLDLGTATKEARSAGLAGQSRLLKLLGIYRILNAYADAVQLLKK
jgi:hypothetical protein